MDECQTNMFMNRHDEIPPGERQRSELSAVEEPARPTKIIDLNDDCLVKIFKSLNIEDLFNVAVANEWLRPAANSVYKRKFGAKKIHLNGVCGDTSMLSIKSLSTNSRRVFNSYVALVHRLHIWKSKISLDMIV